MEGTGTTAIIYRVTPLETWFGAVVVLLVPSLSHLQPYSCQERLETENLLTSTRHNRLANSCRSSNKPTYQSLSIQELLVHISKSFQEHGTWLGHVRTPMKLHFPRAGLISELALLISENILKPEFLRGLLSSLSL